MTCTYRNKCLFKNKVVEGTKLKNHMVIILGLFFSASMCVGCGSSQNEQSGTVQGEVATHSMVSNKETETDLSIDTEINTEYLPIDYRKNALIVQRSEDIELYGLVDDKGNVVLEPEYDSLKFTSMNGENYIKATLARDSGILYLNGREYIEMGQYEEIVSAGDIGWLAFQGGKQYLLDEEGEVIKELKGMYSFCIGNQYLFDSNSRQEMRDGRGDETYEIKQLSGDIYDLDENLIISAELMNIYYYDWLVGGNMFAVDILDAVESGTEKGTPTLIDLKGNIVAVLGDDPNIHIVDVMMDEQKIVLKNTLEPYENLFEYNLSSGTITDTAFKSEAAWDAQIIAENEGSFWEFYKNGKPLLDERFADYSIDNGVLWLRNIDGEWGIVDYNGKMIIPFGEIDSGGSCYRGKELSVVVSNGMFGFYVESSGGYEFHNYVVAEGRICQ